MKNLRERKRAQRNPGETQGSRIVNKVGGNKAMGDGGARALAICYLEKGAGGVKPGVGVRGIR